MAYRFPFAPYPDGWYQIALGRQVKAKDIFSVTYFGKDLVAFRGENGRVTVMDAHCPHLGAHIGVGGKVVGDTVRCPFHGWRFNQQGVCIDIPYCDKIPKKAKFKTYPCREQNGVISIFYSEHDNQPTYEIPAYAAFTDPKWSSIIHLSYEVQSHVQEMAENAVDMGHFPFVHGYKEVPKIKQLDTNGPALTIQFVGQRRMLGITNSFDVTLHAVGLGLVFATTVTDMVTAHVIHSATPINENLLRIGVTFVFNKTWNPVRNVFLRQYLPGEIFRFTDGDRAVLANKIYRELPALCSEEKPITTLRRWARQFYVDSNAQSELAQQVA